MIIARIIWRRLKLWLVRRLLALSDRIAAGVERLG
jgi:hypothetical protein